MKKTFLKEIVLCLSASILILSSCSDNDGLPTNKDQNVEKMSIKDAVLSFSSRDDILNAVNSDSNVVTRAVTVDNMTGKEYKTKYILSLTDKVQSDDPILNEVSADEKKIILEEGMTYYEMYGCEDYIPSESFAKLLNSNREIQLEDSVYKITEYGTLRADTNNRAKLKIAYEVLKNDSTIALKAEPFIPVVKGVELHPLEKIDYLEEQRIGTRTVASDLPTSTFKHYSAESKTILGKILGSIFGDRSVKHHEFINNRRVNGSLYSYDYLVYSETGCFVSMSKKRGGFLKFINGWKDIDADELFMQYRGVVLEMNLSVPQGFLPSAPSNKKPEVVSYSDLRIQGLDHIYHNTVDVLGYNVTEKDLYKFIGQGSKQLFNLLEGWLGNPQSLEQRFGVNGQVPAVRILTPDKLYIVIPDDIYNPKNTKQYRKVFSSGVKFYVSITNNQFGWSDFLKSVQGTRNIPVKKLVGGEVLLAGKLGGQWGGMFIKKN